MVVTALPRIKLPEKLQSPKAIFPIETTELGIVNSPVKNLQYPNASLPIEVMEVGSVMAFREVLPLNALCGISLEG